MKKKFIIQAILGQDISKDSFDHICGVFPSLSHTSYYAELVEGSQELADFKALVKSLNIDLIYYPDSRKRRLPECIKVHGEIELSRDDFKTDYFSVTTLIDLFKSNPKFLDGGLFSFTKDQINPLQEIGRSESGSCPNTIVIKNSLKADFEAQRFEGLSLKAVHASDDSEVVLWAIGSSIVLPPSHNSFVDKESKFWPGSTKFFADFYNTNLLRYSLEDLSSVAPFDVAVTHEYLGFATKKYLVVSSRFRQWTLDRGLRLICEPIIIEN